MSSPRAVPVLAVAVARVPERTVQDNLVREAKALNWMVYHTWMSRHSEPGFPDLFLCHPQTGALLAFECKTEKGKVSEAQDRWLKALIGAGVMAMVVRPSNLEDAYRWLVERAS